MRPQFKKTADVYLDEAWEHSESQEPGLGDRFLHQMEHEFSTLMRTVGLHRMQRSYYRFVTKRFHQLIFCRIEAGQPVIYAVLDGRRDPTYNNKKMQRLD